MTFSTKHNNKFKTTTTLEMKTTSMKIAMQKMKMMTIHAILKVMKATIQVIVTMSVLTMIQLPHQN